MNWVGIVLRIALFLTIVSFAAGACSFVVNTDPYQAGCGSQRKYCQLDTGDFACVSNTDPAYGCGRAACIPCVLPHAAGTDCDPTTGGCRITGCTVGYQNCNTNQDDGCETRVDSDTNHCGTCMTDCDKILAMTPNAAHVRSVKCVSQQCKVNICEPGWLDCDGFLLSNGCEMADPGCRVCCPVGQTCNATSQMCQ